MQGGGNASKSTYTDPFRGKKTAVLTTPAPVTNSPPTTPPVAQPPATTPGATASGTSFLDSLVQAITGGGAADARYVSPSPPQSAYDACKLKGGTLLDDGTCLMPTGPQPLIDIPGALQKAAPFAILGALAAGWYFFGRK
jgi:hypothetical protein